MSNDRQDNQRAQPIHCPFYKTFFTSLSHWDDCVRSWFEVLLKESKVMDTDNNLQYVFSNSDSVS